MNADTVIELGRQAMNVTVLLAAPLLLSALAAGLMIGMFQAATQIQDMTLSFIPKLVVLVGASGPRPRKGGASHPAGCQRPLFPVSGAPYRRRGAMVVPSGTAQAIPGRC